MHFPVFIHAWCKYTCGAVSLSLSGGLFYEPCGPRLSKIVLFPMSTGWTFSIWSRTLKRPAYAVSAREYPVCCRIETIGLYGPDGSGQRLSCTSPLSFLSPLGGSVSPNPGESSHDPNYRDSELNLISSRTPGYTFYISRAIQLSHRLAPRPNLAACEPGNERTQQATSISPRCVLQAGSIPGYPAHGCPHIRSSRLFASAARD